VASVAREHDPAPVAAPPDVGFVGGESPHPGLARADSEEPLGVDEQPSAGARVWSLTKLLLGLGMVIGISLGAALGARHYAMTTPRFSIERLEVMGARRLTTEAVSRQAEVGVGQNIFAIDLLKAETKLLEDPWVKKAKITRRLPRVLRVELEEYQAAALTSIGPELFLVTKEGQPFKALGEADPFDLPVVTGISSENLARDRAREVERIRAGIEVLRLYESLPLHHAFPAQEVHLAPSGAATLTIGKQAVGVHLGKGDWRQKLSMAARVMSRVQREGKVPGIIFADNEAHPERVVVRMRP
jgi:cell division protein FtsQ